MTKKPSLNTAAYAFLGTVLLGVLCGCGVGRPVLVADRPEIMNLLLSGRKPLDCQVSVAPAVLAVPEAGAGEDAYVAYGNAQTLALEDTIAGVLREFELFGEVVPEAQATNPYFEIAAQVTGYEVAYRGRNSTYVPNLVCWWFSPWVSWLVADENYSATLRADVSVKNADTSQQVWGELIETEVVAALNDYQRGTKWFSIYSIGELTSENWGLVEKTLRPHLVEAFKAKLLERLLSLEAQTAIHEAAEEIKRNRLPLVDWAVVVGINAPPQLGKKYARWCVESAKRFAKALRAGGYEKVIELYDVKAADIKAALENAASQEEVRMTRLLFYFAGVGASEYKRDKRALTHSLLDSGGGTLSLTELAALLEKVGAQQRIVILDAGFMPDKLGRGIRLNAIPREAAVDFPKEMVSGSSGFLSACGPGQGAAEDDDLKTCLFSHYLLKAISAGATSLKEIAESEAVRIDLARHTSFKHGTSQESFLGKNLRGNAVLEAKK